MKIFSRIVVIALFLAIIMVGCAKVTQTPKTTPEPNSQGNAQQQMEVTGQYIGQIDNNSIELLVESGFPTDTNNKNVAFRLSDEVKPQFDLQSGKYLKLEKNQTVKITVVKNNSNQWVIKEISKIGHNILDSKTTMETKGNYVGRIDNSSAEIIINGKPQAFRLSEEVAKFLDMTNVDTNREVVLHYYQNNYDQLVITKLELLKK